MISSLSLIGHGDIVATNNLEKMFVAFISLLGCACFAYIFS